MTFTHPNGSVEYKIYTDERSSHWNLQAARLQNWKSLGGAYHSRLTECYQQIIPPGSRILELGCGTGDLLAALQPSYGVGIDFSKHMVELAMSKYPEIKFIWADAHDVNLKEDYFDYVILSDLVNDLWDVQKVLSNVAKFCTHETRVIVNFYSRIWEFPLWLASTLGLTIKQLPQNWLTREDLLNLLHLSGLEVVNGFREILLPLNLSFLSRFFNKVVVKCFPFNYFALSNILVCRKAEDCSTEPGVSVIIPARNEAGNIDSAFQRVPEMGSGTQIIFVEGNSTDDTYERIQQAVAQHPERNCQVYRQTGKGKADAVRMGFDHAAEEILMILDADLTVLPEDLPRFYDALRTNKGEFINGVRLVYPMEKEAMRFFNLLGNKFFSLAFSWLLGQPVKDTLCGTKVLWKKDYERIKKGRSYFGDFDPFGDFDLLFGAAKLKLKIIDLPIRYHERTYGSTNISRWSHGWLLIKMVVFAAKRLKFI